MKRGRFTDQAAEAWTDDANDGEVTLEVVMYGGNRRIIKACGKTVPTSGTTYAHGCQFLKLDGSANNDGVYVNIAADGATCDFDALTIT